MLLGMGTNGANDHETLSDHEAKIVHRDLGSYKQKKTSSVHGCVDLIHRYKLEMNHRYPRVPHEGAPERQQRG